MSLGTIFVKASSRARSYSRKKALGKVNRAISVKERLKDKAYLGPRGRLTPGRAQTLQKRYAVADRYEANAKSARRARRAIGYRSRRAKGYWR